MPPSNALQTGGAHRLGHRVRIAVDFLIEAGQPPVLDEISVLRALRANPAEHVPVVEFHTGTISTEERVIGPLKELWFWVAFTCHSPDEQDLPVPRVRTLVCEAHN